MPRYVGRVNCIYIDPPYNTGNESWVYNDNVNSPMMKEWLKDKGPVDGEDLERHDKWLCMMWPRLLLLRELLAEDGAIFVSIDDNEQHHLRMVMDEVFGEENFVAVLVKKTKIGGGSDSRHFVKEHDYILSYCNNMDLLNPMFVSFSKDYLPRYKESDHKGEFFWDTFARPGLKNPITYTITAPDGKRIKGDWIRSKSRFKKDLHSGEIKFSKKKGGNWSVFFKQRLNSDGRKPRTLSKELGGTIDGKNEIREIFENDRAFEYPKSYGMIKFLLESVNNPNAIVLDSFAGSGTTAHAVLDLNKQDSGSRKFILVECEDKIADNITAERVRRVIKGVPKSKNQNLKKGLGGSFTYCTLGDEMSIEKMLTGQKLPDYEILARHIFWTATGQSMEKINPKSKRGKDGLFHETKDKLYYLIYEPKLTFLRSNESALNSVRAERIEKKSKIKKKTAVVFATHKFMGQKKLTEMGITFCDLTHNVFII